MGIRNMGQSGDISQTILALLPVLAQINQMQLQSKRDERRDTLAERKFNLDQESRRDQRIQGLIGLLDSKNDTQKNFAITELSKLGVDVGKDGKPKASDSKTAGSEFERAGIGAAGGQIVKTGLKNLRKFTSGTKAAEQLGAQLDDTTLTEAIMQSLSGKDSGISDEQNALLPGARTLPGQTGRGSAIDAPVTGSVDFNSSNNAPFGTYKGVPIGSEEGRQALIQLLSKGSGI